MCLEKMERKFSRFCGLYRDIFCISFHYALMKLKTLLNIHGHLDWRQQSQDSSALSLSQDSRSIEVGSVYVAIRGHQSDGHNYLKQAIDGGAIALVVEDTASVPASYPGAVLQVLDTRLSLQTLSQRFFGHPGDQLTAIAVTGTNGKTSTAYMVEFLLSKAGQRCGVIGTIDHHIGNKNFSTSLTTPDPVTLQQRLQDFVDHSGDAFVIEASSHALEQNRIHQGFDVCVFTNLSRDHLDYHKTMEAYFQSKAKLFKADMVKDGRDGFALVNGDDSYGAKMAQEVESRKVILFGQDSKCDLRFKVKETSLDGSTVELQRPDGLPLTFQVPLLGVHNVYNMVGALGVLYAMGLNISDVTEQVKEFKGVPGRMQGVKSVNGAYGFIDYAHTPEALEQALSSLKRQLQPGKRLICVFGCGGDRDPGKRPIMGEVAGRMSDLAIVTSDNPRSEDPLKIIEQIVGGMKEASFAICEDRGQAIAKAVASATDGDVILVAGKGHEDYQIIGETRLVFSDYDKLTSEMT